LEEGTSETAGGKGARHPTTGRVSKRGGGVKRWWRSRKRFPSPREKKKLAMVGGITPEGDET